MDVGIEQLRTQVTELQASMQDCKYRVSCLERSPTQQMSSRGCSVQAVSAQTVPMVASMQKVQVSSAAAPPASVVPWSFVAQPPNQHRPPQVITSSCQSPGRLSPRQSPRASLGQLPTTPTMQAAPQTVGQQASQQQNLMRTVSSVTISKEAQDSSRRSPLPQERRALGLLHQRLAGRVSGIVSVLSQQPASARPHPTAHQPGQPKQLQQQNRWQASLRQRQPQQPQQHQTPPPLSPNLNGSAAAPVVPPLHQVGDCEPCVATPKASGVPTTAPATESSRRRSGIGARKGRRHSICIAGSAEAEVSSDSESVVVTSRSAASLSNA